MRGAQNSSGAPPRVGRPFRKGLSSNPGGRPKGLARAARELVGEDGMALVKLWWSIGQDPMQRTRDRRRRCGGGCRGVQGEDSSACWRSQAGVNPDLRSPKLSILGWRASPGSSRGGDRRRNVTPSVPSAVQREPSDNAEGVGYALSQAIPSLSRLLARMTRPMQSTEAVALASLLRLDVEGEPLD
jgi:hypothetical protein